MASVDIGSTAPGDEKLPPLEEYVFDPNDDFYLAPPAARLLHYRTAAMVVGGTEVVLLIATLFVFLHLHLHIGITGLYSSLFVMTFLIIACLTSGIMIVGIVTEKPMFMIPQISFLKLAIFVMLIFACISITSMSLGIEWTTYLFEPFVNVPMMEASMGPIWPFNLATVSFSGAALGIFFHKLVEGCHEFLLDKEFFDNRASQQIEMNSTKKD